VLSVRCVTSPKHFIIQHTLEVLCLSQVELHVNPAGNCPSVSAASDSMFQITDPHPSWPVYADVFEHPPSQLASRRPTWSDMTSVDTITQWREDWSSASVLNHTIATDPTIQQPGFHLPCHTWSLMNRFQTGQGPCRASLHKWGLTQSPSCDCGQRQTINHIVDTCPLIKSEGGRNLLHEAADDAVVWLESTATAALMK